MNYFTTVVLILVVSILADNILRTKVLHRWKTLALAFFLGLVVVIPWDSFAIMRGHWVIGQTVGITFGVLPLEEIIAVFDMLLIPVIAWEYWNKQR